VTPARRVPTVTRGRKTATGALAVYCLLLLGVLLVPDGGLPSSSIGWVATVADRIGLPHWLLDAARFEFICNVLILVPATFLGAIVWRAPTWRGWAAGGLVFSSTIELIQALFLPGRTGSMVDVVANTLGALIGALVVVLGRTFVRQQPGLRRKTPVSAGP
jgi:hypothetical protein